MALLHVCIRDVDVAQQLAQGPEVGTGFRGRAQVGLRDDLEERDARTVEVHVGAAAARHRSVVDRLPRIFLHVDPSDPDALGEAPAAGLLAVDLDPAIRRKRLLVLGDLVALGKVGIEVVLPCKDRARMHRTVHGERGPHPEFHSARVQDRQGPRKREAHGAGMVVRIIAVAHAATAKELRFGAKLRMHLEPDHDFVVDMRLDAHAGSGGRRLCQSVRR